MAARRFAWVLNLDADLELASRGGYTPKQSVRDATASFSAVLARELLGAEDVVVDEASRPGSAVGFVGRAFCPTPRALDLLRRAGAEAEPAPAASVLRRVNSRAFASSLGVTLPGGAFVTTLDAATAKLAEPPPVGDAWRIKRAFGMTGRGQRVVRAAAVSDHDVAFVRASLPDGMQIEPNVEIAAEYAVHGRLDETGGRAIGAVVTQHCDARGAWQSTHAFSPRDAAETEVVTALLGEASRVADALAGAGYYGPFGVDAYTYHGPHGALSLQPRSEINARYSMGFAVGFGQLRS